MNADLEETLNELGPGYRTVVGRLRAGLEVGCGSRRRMTSGWIRWRGAHGRGIREVLLAASILVALALSRWFCDLAPQVQPSPQIRRSVPREYRMTPSEMIATQRADGSWANDFLTKHNADALKNLDDPRAQVAYKKAMRNLRLRQAL